MTRDNLIRQKPEQQYYGICWVAHHTCGRNLRGIFFLIFQEDNILTIWPLIFLNLSLISINCRFAHIINLSPFRVQQQISIRKLLQLGALRCQILVLVSELCYLAPVPISLYVKIVWPMLICIIWYVWSKVFSVRPQLYIWDKLLQLHRTCTICTISWTSETSETFDLSWTVLVLMRSPMKSWNSRNRLSMTLI